MRGIAGIFDSCLTDLLREAEHEGNWRGRAILAVKETGLLRSLVNKYLGRIQNQLLLVWSELDFEALLAQVTS